MTGELAEVRGQKIGFIFQTFNLLPQLSALANVELGMRYAGGVEPRARRGSLTSGRPGERVHHRPIELSGGEQQRVAIARALVRTRPCILADEPTGNLDSHSGEEVMGILTTLHAERGITLIMITHDATIAHQCQRIIHIHGRRCCRGGNL